MEQKCCIVVLVSCCPLTQSHSCKKPLQWSVTFKYNNNTNRLVSFHSSLHHFGFRNTNSGVVDHLRQQLITVCTDDTSPLNCMGHTHTSDRGEAGLPSIRRADQMKIAAISVPSRSPAHTQTNHPTRRSTNLWCTSHRLPGVEDPL